MIGNQSGNDGEKTAAGYLEKLGYKILEKNYTTRYGEIDIIARKGEIIAFVEVKKRKAGAKVTGLQSVSQTKQKRIVMTSVEYLQDLTEDLQPRYDVVSVIVFPDGRQTISHIEGAFSTEGIFY